MSILSTVIIERILSYPLDDTDYTAEEAQLYNSTRTSGVFSSERHFGVTPVVTQPMSVSLSPGLGWISYDEFAGIVVAKKEDVLIQLPTAHASLTRIDRIVLRYDASLNDVFIGVKVGAPASNPVGQPLQRDLTAWELCVADIRVTPGSIILTQAQIVDTRLNEDLCGIMRDGVTGIPTQVLHDAFTTWMQESQTEFALWVESIREILGEEAAGNLLNMIEDMKTNGNINLAGVPYLVWLYTHFPDKLTSAQIAEIESNGDLMAIVEQSRLLQEITRTTSHINDTGNVHDVVASEILSTGLASATTELAAAATIAQNLGRAMGRINQRQHRLVANSDGVGGFRAMNAASGAAWVVPGSGGTWVCWGIRTNVASGAITTSHISSGASGATIVAGQAGTSVIGFAIRTV